MKKVTFIRKIVGIPLLALLLVNLIPLQVAQALNPADPPQYVSQFGSSGNGNGELNYPSGMVIDADGNMYVADNGNDRVQKFSSSGAYISQFGTNGSGDGELYCPGGMVIDASGNLYVVDSCNDRVQKFSSSGAYISQFGSSGSGNGQFDSPYGIALDSNGDMYVTDASNARVQKFSSSGAYISQFGTLGTGDGQFSYAYFIDIDSVGNIYVTDSEYLGATQRVQKFSSSGAYISQFGTLGTGDGQFRSPTGIAIDSNDNIYVVDNIGNRVQKFSSSGAYISQFGSSGSGNGQFNEPLNIMVNGSNVYVSDTQNYRIQKFSYPAEKSLTASNGAAILMTATPLGTNITCSSVVNESSLAKQDPNKSYPLGLVDFCLSVPSGGTSTVSLTFVTDLTPTQVTARKYNSVTQTYGNVTGAAITATTLNSQNSLTLTYNITDGGAMDEDGVANGFILDPVGLAIDAVEATLADTGDSQQAVLVFSILLITIGTGIPILLYRTRRHKVTGSL